MRGPIIDAVIRRPIDEKRLAGAVTLVFRKGRVVLHEAYGLMDVESKRPMERDARFRMASSTKPVTGVAVMMLVEEGKVRLGDPASKFIPELGDAKVAIGRNGTVELVPAERPGAPASSAATPSSGRSRTSRSSPRRTR